MNEQPDATRDRIALDLGHGVRMPLALIPAGRFTMGSPPDEPGRYDNEELLREQVIARAFYMGICPVTQDQYSAVTGVNPSHFPGADHPVQRVSFYEAQEFCTRLSSIVQRTVCLPTEAQWEYACRAGTRTAYLWGDDPNEGAGWCNAADQTAKAVYPEFKAFAWSDGYVHTSPVGRFRPNAWGLYDMPGNVWEWCSDLYCEVGAQEPTGAHRILRGGSWDNGPTEVRSARRLRGTAAARSMYVGFRVVVELQGD